MSRGIVSHAVMGGQPAAAGAWALRHGIINTGDDSYRVDDKDCTLAGNQRWLADRPMLGGGVCRLGWNQAANAATVTFAPGAGEERRFTSCQYISVTIDDAQRFFTVVLPAGTYLLDISAGSGVNANNNFLPVSFSPEIYDGTGWDGGAQILVHTVPPVTPQQPSKGIWCDTRANVWMDQPTFLARAVNNVNMVEVPVTTKVTADATGISIRYARGIANSTGSGNYVLNYIRVYETA